MITLTHQKVKPTYIARPAYVLTEQETDWRRDCLKKIGAADETAQKIVTDSTIDIHDVARLASQGCSFELAYEILH